MSDFAELPTALAEGNELWQKFNHKHNPCPDPMKIKLSKGVLLIQRMPTPEETVLSGKIIRPAGDKVKYRFAPNCAKIVKVHEESNCQVGHYAFWTYAGYDTKKPQPVVYQFSDHAPSFFLLKEEDMLCSCPSDELSSLEKSDFKYIT